MKKMILVFVFILLFSNAVFVKGYSIDIPEVSRDKVICFALYTTSDHIMKMTTQLYPLEENEDKVVRLEIEKNGEWCEIAKAEIIKRGWTAQFRVENWDMTKDIKYRLAHGKTAYYTGLIRKDPIDKETIVVAAFTGNSVLPNHGGDISRIDLIENIKKIDPDLLFFSGDQVYNHTKHYTYWLKFGRDFGEVIRNIPTVTIPDDHDVGQVNLWGASGKKSATVMGTDGGYFQPVEYVKEVERAQTSHLPDPYDPTPVQQGIGVYYTSMKIGRIDFAIIEDRKFKSGLEGLIPQMGPTLDHIRDPNYDPQSVDVPGAVLLGDRQLKFLRNWGANWGGVDMKAVLSQTIFCGGAHLHGKTGRLHADLDSNGWPQRGRNKALAEIRKGFAVHIAGDQHLGTLFHHGIDEWEDAGYSFCVPSIANLFMRWWKPDQPGENRQPGMPEYTGRTHDGFGNKVTCWAAANPSQEPRNGDLLTTRAAGFGVIKFHKKTRQITFECWPRNVDITDSKTKQYTGWPKTVDQMDNYGRKAVAYLPTLKFETTKNPIVQIIDDSVGEIVYTLRINETTFRPKVFRKGTYTIKVGREKLEKTYNSIEALSADQSKTIHVKM